MSILRLGLDIGSNSIGFALLNINESKNQIVFDELERNSIVFSEPSNAEDRRKARGARRRNERKSTRNIKARKVFVDFQIAAKEFIDDTTYYINNLKPSTRDVYNLREKAVNGAQLTKDEFLLATYSILTDRGYNNMFAIDSSDEEEGKINEAINKNKQIYSEENYLLPSMVLTSHRKELEKKYQNIPIRNKADDYRNSLSRDMHKEEFKKVVLSQLSNTEIFLIPEECNKFIENILNEDEINSPFYQRPLKSFEDMVEYCTFYDKYNPKGSYKRVPLANIKNIESTLRQKLDNHEIIESKTGVIATLSKEDIDKVIDFWTDTPSSSKIDFKNILKSAGFKNFELFAGKNVSDTILDIKAYIGMQEILKKYNIDFKTKDNEFYNDVLLQLYYFKNKKLRVEKINDLIKKYDLSLDINFSNEIASLSNMDGFGSLSLKFINEILDTMKAFNLKHHEALEKLGYFSKHIGMPTYNYLPPLEPTKADIRWLQEKIPYFDMKHLFYQPMISPKVKRVISVLRKLINEIIFKYGPIDEIVIETAKELNSTSEAEQIKENQAKDKKKNDEAKKYLKDKKIVENDKNVERAKLFIEQRCKCLFSGENITDDDAFDENKTEIEHFIPRSIIWINSYKNKILVKKKYNQNKSNQNPIAYLTSKGEWEKFKNRVEELSISPNKKEWLTNEEIINSAMAKDNWQDSYLNDTKTATRVIQKYLNHYLFPYENAHGKDAKKHIFSVTGRAINELKYLWGINAIMPKDENGKKDRNTNYHHTLDAFTIALCSNSAIKNLHDYFKQKENKFKTQAIRENLKASLPKTSTGINIVEHLKSIVKKYEANELYVCPYNKRKTNMKGFKDGNLKLYITKSSNGKEILAEIEKIDVNINNILMKPKKQGQGFERRCDDEVLSYVKSIQQRLDSNKQGKIIKAMEIYTHELLVLRSKIEPLDEQIKEIRKNLKISKSKKEHLEENEQILAQIKPLEELRDMLIKQQQELRCSFATKNGKQQIVRSLRLPKIKLEESKADAIIFTARKENKINRLNVENFKKAIENKEPFLIKANESTLNVRLFETKSKGQAVGLNYFSSIANKIDTKINERYTGEIDEKSTKTILYKNDIIKVRDAKNQVSNIYIFNGGGNISGGNNKLEVKGINSLLTQRLFITLNKLTIASKVKIDFFGNITED